MLKMFEPGIFYNRTNEFQHVFIMFTGKYMNDDIDRPLILNYSTKTGQVKIHTENPRWIDSKIRQGLIEESNINFFNDMDRRRIIKTFLRRKWS